MEAGSHLRKVYGVDFSGASDAGRKIWIACGINEGNTLQIAECHRAAELPGSDTERDRAIAALRDLIAREQEAIFGLDFPFGLPRALVGTASWEAFVLSFPERYSSPQAFKQACWTAAGCCELRRVTDAESRTPFSAYNERLYRQTYHGIRDVLSPLVERRRACVLPMQRAQLGRAWLLEVCPASTLKRERLYRYDVSYKGKGAECYVARQRIVEAMEGTRSLSIPQTVRTRILADPGGDALDSVIAAWATFRALPHLASLGRQKEVYAVEGYVYY